MKCIFCKARTTFPECLASKVVLASCGPFSILGLPARSPANAHSQATLLAVSFDSVLQDFQFPTHFKDRYPIADKSNLPLSDSHRLRQPLRISFLAESSACHLRCGGPSHGDCPATRDST